MTRSSFGNSLVLAMVSAAALAIGCEGIDQVSADVPLADPCSGELTGYIDGESGNYVFDNGHVVEPSVVENVEKVSPPQCRKVESADDGPTPRFAWSNGYCWVFQEAGASCVGCCINNRCTESCTDTMKAVMAKTGLIYGAIY